MRTLLEYQTLVNERLNALFPEQEKDSAHEGSMPELLRRSMLYSLTAGGKRLRPSMLLAAYELFGGRAEDALDFACAVEMIHSYSLIHDDLPGMDDDCLRRGRPTNHVVFGVGQAILAGDGLLNAAFELMLRRGLCWRDMAENCMRAIYEIATGAGVTGMIGGQVMDLWCEQNQVCNEAALSYIQRGKTACMFIYPLRAAGCLAGADETQIDALGRYGEAFGRMFQAADDLLDVLGDAGTLGKTIGKDAEHGKLTMVSLQGIEGTKAYVLQQLDCALSALSSFGEDADFFRALVRSMLGRSH